MLLYQDGREDTRLGLQREEPYTPGPGADTITTW